MNTSRQKKPADSKFRTAALRISIILGAAAILLAVSIASSLFELSAFISGPGNFFVKSYGGLAFLIPVYLIYAAFLLADPRYKPDRIFILASVPIPFFTAALGCYIIRDFEFLAVKSRFLEYGGRFGTGFLFTLLTAAEVFLIILIRSAVFEPNGRFYLLQQLWLNRSGKNKNQQDQAGRPGQKPIALLPSPKHRKLKDIYTESAAMSDYSLNTPTTKTAVDTGGTVTATVSPGADSSEAAAPDVIEISDADTLEPEELLPESEGLPEPETEDSEPETDNVPGADDDVERALAQAEEEAARHGSGSQVSQEKPDAGKSEKYKGLKKRRVPYLVPVEGLLNQYPDGEYWIIDEATRNSAVTLKETLKEFNIQAEVTGIKKGPVITMFEILPAPGVKLSRIVNLQDNIALRLAASSVRIVAPIPGKHAVGIEVPNAKRNIVSFREIIEDELLREGKKPEIPIVLGKDITGEAQTVDLAAMPHLLIAGATGSGKSVCVNSMILSVLYQKPPAECRLILIDPKIVELKLYNDIPHLLTPVITEPKRAFQALQYCICEMERRYACLDSMGVRDIRSYNKRIKERNMASEYMPYIIVVVDEFADLMATTGKELESTVARLAAMSRAVGIHLVLATQRPSIDIITGLIKANIPSRIAFMVASKMDSRIIIDMVGAEKLLGRGDMLYAGAVDPFPVRMQGAFVSEEEVEKVVEYIKTLGEPDYIDEEIFYDDEEDEGPSLFTDGDDPLYEKALEIVYSQNKASASYIQRRLKIGYNRAARLVEEMEHRGVVGPAQGSKPREILHGYSA